MNRPSLTRTARAIRLGVVRVRNIRSNVSHGSSFAISPNATIAPKSTISVGHRVSIGPGFTALANLTTGDDILISANVGVIGNDHPFDESEKTLSQFPRTPLAHVHIEGDSLIGYGAVLMGDITIGRGAIVGARSLVISNVPANAIVAGVPARIIRYRRTQ